ncbi:MAG TPA: Uma2 family endonuclease [Planctomycetota bacterium]|nr:Uma2 family endonuclease [Planctomycetota bacterium]
MTTTRRRAPRAARRGRLVSLEEFERNTPSYSCELVDGKIVRMTPASRPDHGLVAWRISTILIPFVLRKRLGAVIGAEQGYVYRVEPASVRAPDLAFLGNATLAAFKNHDAAGFFRRAPDLVIEVRSPSNTWKYLERKSRDALAAGAKLAWVFDPKTRTVRVLAPDAPDRILGERQFLTGGEVLPGFRARVSRFLVDLKR